VEELKRRVELYMFMLSGWIFTTLCVMAFIDIIIFVTLCITRGIDKAIIDTTVYLACLQTWEVVAWLLYLSIFGFLLFVFLILNIKKPPESEDDVEKIALNSITFKDKNGKEKFKAEEKQGGGVWLTVVEATIFWPNPKAKHPVELDNDELMYLRTFIDTALAEKEGE